ncbi:MAG: histidinol phosphate phosphatase domain-containing protein [Candidatus Omnitrophica bacterium]|nr:histidinol phosphate phosphatase domain-containing protein [Candidatus Omnitrophota bacterium]MDD4013851.1 histidinol phosphate phosphatase domain-containing protein [Candidatus Omnitrophota bacterium]
MIDLHTHTLLSDGELLPSELVRRAYVVGYKAIALTDHVDRSNIDIVVSGLVRAAKSLNRYWDIVVIPGVEITHVPLEDFSSMVKYARAKGARMIVGHGESPVEPVVPGTNRAAILAGVDILAHPGMISDDDARLAAEKKVFLEITARRGHSQGNSRVFEAAGKVGADMVLNTDSHSPQDLLTAERAAEIIKGLSVDETFGAVLARNSGELVRKAGFKP